MRGGQNANRTSLFSASLLKEREDVAKEKKRTVDAGKALRTRVASLIKSNLPPTTAEVCFLLCESRFRWERGLWQELNAFSVANLTSTLTRELAVRKMAPSNLPKTANKQRVISALATLIGIPLPTAVGATTSASTTTPTMSATSASDSTLVVSCSKAHTKADKEDGPLIPPPILERPRRDAVLKRRHPTDSDEDAGALSVVEDDSGFSDSEYESDGADLEMD